MKHFLKHIVKILSIAIIVGVVLFSVIHVFIMLQGRSILTKEIEKVFHKKTNVGFIHYTMPLNLELRNLNIEGLVKAERIYISISPLYLLTGRLAFNNIRFTGPEFTYERFAPPPAVETPPPEAQNTIKALAGKTISPARKEPAKKRPNLRLIFKRINIRYGRINFIDHTVGTEGIKLVIKDLNFDLTNLYTFSQRAATNFDLKAKIPWQVGQEEGKIEGEGWLNFHSKSMEAELKINNIDGIYLYPYYSNWVDLEKARIEKATLNFTSGIHGLNNNVTADCHLELSDIVRSPRPDDEPQEKAEKITDTILDTFRTLGQGKIVLDFTIRTKMDRPEFGFGNIKMAFENKLTQARAGTGFKPEDILVLPGNLLKGAVKGATDLSKAVIDGTFAVGNEIKKTVEDTFKKEPIQKKN